MCSLNVSPERHRISYVFWHWPRSAVSTRRYEARLAGFQNRLRKSRPPGLLRMLSFKTDALPWRSKRGTWYEDWYVLSDFADLGILNSAAVAKGVLHEHNSVARLAAGGEGGVYKLIMGTFAPERARVATWTRKPQAMSYQTYLGKLEEATKGSRVCVWQRQMSLGRGPEFCIQSDRHLGLAKAFEARLVSLQLVKA